MAKKRIAWEELEPGLRQLEKEALLEVLHAAYQALPATRLATVFGDHIELKSPKAIPKAAQEEGLSGVLEGVEFFRAQSLAGEYYESFAVNSRNFSEQSAGTERWIEECNELFGECVQLSQQGQHEEACQGMELLFELLAEIDTGSDLIIFFADEPGSWQVGIADEKILPAYFTSLAAIAEPEDYATKVAATIQEYGAYNSSKYFEIARQVATSAQREQLGPRKSNERSS